MRWTHAIVVIVLATLWTSCSSTRWVHPTKKEEQLTYDWNKCERDWMNNLTINPGAAGTHDSPMIERQRIFRCLQKNGWRQVEDQ